MKIINKAIGQYLAKALETSALYRAEMPLAFDLEDVREITLAVNSVFPPIVDGKREIPFCILLREEDETNPYLLNPLCLEMDPPNSIEYREGNRLAIIADEPALQHSITSAYTRVLMDGSFPLGIGSEDRLRAISVNIMEIILENLAVATISPDDKSEISSRIENVLHQLSETHRSESETSARYWNDNWYRHISLGVENLNSIFQTLKETSDTNESVIELFAKWTYASFGLPFPRDGKCLIPASGSPGKEINKALELWWSNQGNVVRSIEYLRQHPDTQSPPHALEALDWNVFEDSRVNFDSALLGFLEMARESLEYAEAFCQFTERQFFNPLPKADNISRISVRDFEGNELALPLTGSGELFLTSVEQTGDLQFRSEFLQIHVDSLGMLNEELAKTSSIRISTHSNTVEWDGTFEVSESHDSLIFSGHFEWCGDAEFTDSIVKHVKVGVSFPDGDVISGLIDRRASANLGFVPPTRSGVALWHVRANAAPKAIEQLQPLILSNESFHTSAESPDSEVALGIFAWGFGALVETEPMPEVHVRGGWYFKTLDFYSTTTVRVGEDSYRIDYPEPKLAEQSPIVAAIRKVPLTSEPIDEVNSNALRGKLESLLVSKLASDLDFGHLHHYIIPEGEYEGLNNVSLVDGLSITCGLENTFNNAAAFKVPRAFRESDEVANFVSAFKALEIENALRNRASSQDTIDLPSRTSWRYLWEAKRAKLDDYLDAYRKMVAKAMELNNPEAIFWASYPFSFSVWDLTNTGRSLAVYLSPLHPLRLGWLASVESTLGAAKNADELAGTIEGWNFPIIGPATTLSGSYIAAPTDNGEGQLFIGWSTLVSASIDEPTSLKAPSSAGGVKTPGIASGGMNSSSTSAAISAYRRINPHVSTLTVDLAAVQKASRLNEIDEAIMEMADSFADDSDSTLIGGMRIFDSLNRLGDPPTHKMKQQVERSVTAPMIWTRYQPSFNNKIQCNIRLLQDSGVRLAVRPKTSRGSSLGIIGMIPMRRFEAFGVSYLDAKYGESSPTLGDKNSNLTSYNAALATIERALQNPIIQSQLHQAVLVDESAEWTVSGESMVSPSGIASMLNVENNGNQMLWEWRPPFLDSKESDLLEKRPFLAVARIPNSFKNQLLNLLQKAFGEESGERLVDELLSKLGGKGVGLSSLLAMGGTHASGALGFYLAIALLDNVQVAGKQLFVLPIDACEPFLKALTGMGKMDSEFTKRADLLMLTLDDDSLVLTPIEIKLYGLGSGNPNSVLPKISGGELKEALGQVESTMQLLWKVKERFESLSTDPNTESDYALWLNALASLVEAAMKMSPVSKDQELQTQARFTSLITGTSKVRAGKPLVTYFGHDAFTSDGKKHAIEKASMSKSLSEDVGLLAANIKGCFDDVETRTFSSKLVGDLTNLVTWSVAIRGQDNTKDGGEANQPVPSPKPRPVPATDSGPQPTPEPDSTQTPVPVPEPEPQPQPEPQPEPGSESKSGLVGNGVEVSVGKTIDGLNSTEVTFWPANTDLNQMNVGVVGDLGTGKTQLLKSLVKQLRDQSEMTQPEGVSFLIFDYKDDYTDEDFVQATGAKVLKPEKIPLNIFKITGPYSKQKAAKRANAFCDVLAKIYSNVGPVQTTQLTEAIVGLFEINGGQPPTIASVLSKYKDLVGKVDSVVSILSKFTMQDIFTEDETEMVDFDELIDGNILVVALSEFAADRATQNAIVVLFLDMYYEHMLKSTKWPFEGDKPKLRRLNSFLLVDEATNIMEYEFDVLERLLLQGRQFGFGVILSSQYLSHFKTKGTNYGEPLLTWVIHKVPSVKTAELQTLGIPNASDSSAKRIAQLGIHQAFYSSLDQPGVVIKGLPFYELVSE